MVVSASRHKVRMMRPVHRPLSAWLPASRSRDVESVVAQPLFTDDILGQFQSLGLAQAAASRFLKIAQRALRKALDGLDPCAWRAAPPAEQASMLLLPRFDIAALARASRLSKADVQSALALLVMNVVTLTRQIRH